MDVDMIRGWSTSDPTLDALNFKIMCLDPDCIMRLLDAL